MAINHLIKDGQLNFDSKVFNLNGNGGILNIATYNGVLGDSRLGVITVQEMLQHSGGWIGKLRSDYTTMSSDQWAHNGELDGTETRVCEAKGVSKSTDEWTYSILFDSRCDISPLTTSLENILQGITVWPVPLTYAGDFNGDPCGMRVLTAHEGQGDSRCRISPRRPRAAKAAINCPKNNHGPAGQMVAINRFYFSYASL